MLDNNYFNILVQTIGRCETRFEKYIIPSLAKPKKVKCICKGEEVQITPSKQLRNVEEYQISQVPEETLKIIEASENFEALTDIVDLPKPEIVIWRYMDKKELEHFLSIRDKHAKRKVIEEKLGADFIKGASRTMIVELIESVTDFCTQLELTIEGTGSVLSIFYLTHRYFTSSLYRTAQETYNYFKEFLFCVSVSCPPESIKLIDPLKSREVLRFFCKIYLRNLPLIRLLCSPNYGFFVDYHVETDELEELIKETRAKTRGKDKKGKKGKGKKKK